MNKNTPAGLDFTRALLTVEQKSSHGNGNRVCVCVIIVSLNLSQLSYNLSSRLCRTTNETYCLIKKQGQIWEVDLNLKMNQRREVNNESDSALE